MDIEELKDKKFFLITFEEEFVWEIEESGIVVIIGEENFQTFKQKVEEKKKDEDFYFQPRAKVSEDKETTHLLKEYSAEFLKKVLLEVKEIDFTEVIVLDKLLEFFIPKSATYLAWGYSLFYDSIMEN